MDRSKTVLALFSLLALFIMSTSATADIYRWDDENGSRHLVNDINEVPAKYREAALADYAKRTATNNRVNVIGDSGDSDAKGASAPQGAPAAAQASPQPMANPMPGGQSEMWWRQNAMQLERNVRAAKSALEKAQTRHDDDDDGVTVVGRGRRGGVGRGPGRHPGRRGGSDSSDYTEYSRETDLDELEVAVDDAERAYQDFHDQARRADVPMGWLRH
jgi:hypothetical protein